MSYPGFDLTGRTAVVVGGTSGIGRALAHGLAQAGADVVCTSRRDDQVEIAAYEIEALNRRTIRCVSDVSSRESIEKLLAACVGEFGKVDILINSAGRTKREPTIDQSEDDWNAILETNLTGTLRTCQIFGRHMIGNGYGRIVNIASLSTFVSLFEVAAYAASKAGVASLTKSLAIEWAKHGVNVNAMSAEKATQAASVNPNSRNSLPKSPGKNEIGTKTEISVSVVAMTAKPISREPVIAATSVGSPSSWRRWTFSSTTIASSTTRPIARTRPSSVNTLIE